MSRRLTNNMTQKYNTIRFLNLRKGHTYKILLNVETLIKWYGEDFDFYEEELDERGRAVEIVYFIDATFNGYEYNDRTGRPELRLYVLKTNLPPLEAGLEVGFEYLLDVFDLTGNPVDITEELESKDGDYYEMILTKVNADRLARGLPPLPISKYLYRLGHKKSTRKPTGGKRTKSNRRKK